MGRDTHEHSNIKHLDALISYIMGNVSLGTLPDKTPHPPEKTGGRGHEIVASTPSKTFSDLPVFTLSVMSNPGGIWPVR